MGFSPDATAPAVTSLPKTFGPYTLLAHLATGGMAEVYLARQVGLQGFEKIVVIKRTRPEMSDPETTRMFVDEARLVATLEHPNIAQVYEIGLVQDSYFFVMEYVHGADLRELLDTCLRRKHQLALADALYILIHVCAALHCAHEKTDQAGQPLGIIHRDVSPSNVLISHDGAVKVCDFGIAKAAGRTRETVRGVLKGKFAYMSPEQCRAQPIDRRSDIFALGILMYETTTMSRLFSANSDYDLMRSIIEGPVELPSVRVPGYPPELERIVMRALSKDPADRYATAQDMQLELEAFGREHKMAMSSINIGKLMGSLFEKRIDAWARAQSDGKAFADHLMDTVGGRDSGDLPVFLPLGSSQDPDITVDPITGIETAPGVAITADAPRPPSGWWLVAATLAALVAGGVMIAGEILPTSSTTKTTALVKADLEKLGAVIDSTATAARMHADGNASTPMLRAAIETDAATMKDFAEHEYTFSIAKNETLEVFQLRNDQMIPLLRLPATAAPLEPLAGSATRIEARGDGLSVVASAPITGPKASIAGVLMVAMPVDLAATKHALGEHATQASLTGLATEIKLVDGTGSPTSFKVPLGGDLTLSAAVAPRAVADSLDWVMPVQVGSAACAAMLLVVFLILRRSRARAYAGSR